MKMQKLIQSLGYSENEAKVYLAALSMGESRVTDIALRLKMPRSSVHGIVESLRRVGLMDFYVQNKHRYWSSARPEKLLDELKVREQKLQEALPKLAALQKSDKAKKAQHSSVSRIRRSFECA